MIVIYFHPLTFGMTVPHFTEKIYRGSGWGLVLSVVWPFILMFSVKICKILMFSVLKKLTVKCLKVLRQ